MELPDRDPNSDDPVVYPYDSNIHSAANNYAIAAWLKWRLKDPRLDGDLRAIMEVEMVEAQQLARLLEGLDQAEGDDLDEKLSDPAQRDALKSLALSWMRTQRALIDVVEEQVSHRAPSNGH